MAGIHPNEVAAIDAVIRLGQTLDSALLRGRVSLLPVVNQPGYSSRTESVIPIDDVNLNFSFPGRPEGTFSEALAHGLLHQWANDAICLVDLHGGDLREDLTRFVVCQLTGDPGFDARQLELARGYGARFLVRLGSEHLSNPGRSITARARQRRHGVFAEGGCHGLLIRDDVDYHRDGVLRVLALHGMYPAPPPPPVPIELTSYDFLRAPLSGWMRSVAAAGDAVEQAQPVAEFVDWRGRSTGTLVAPRAGYILWRVTHPIVAVGDPVVGLGGTHEGA